MCLRHATYSQAAIQALNDSSPVLVQGTVHGKPAVKGWVRSGGVSFGALRFSRVTANTSRSAASFNSARDCVCGCVCVCW